MTFINSKFNGEIPAIECLDEDDNKILQTIKEKVDLIAEEIEASKLQSASNTFILISRIGNQYLNEKEPWKLLKTDPAKAANVFFVCSQIVKILATISIPFIPNTAHQLMQILSLETGIEGELWKEASKHLKSGHKINKSAPLFKKIEGDEKKNLRVVADFYVT